MEKIDPHEQIQIMQFIMNSRGPDTNLEIFMEGFLALQNIEQGLSIQPDMTMASLGLPSSIEPGPLEPAGTTSLLC